MPDAGMPQPVEEPATVAASPVIGKVLGSLLRAADYVAYFFFSEYPGGDAEPLGRAKVALVLPVLSSGHQKVLINLIRATPSTTNLPVIELSTIPSESGNGNVTRVPGGIEDLRRFIDEKLLGDAPGAPKRRAPAVPPRYRGMASQDPRFGAL